jgi:hypothetical protein
MDLKRTAAFGLVSAFLILMLSTSAMAVLLSDQGTGVNIKSTGMPVDDGNLTVQIWDAPTSGSSLYNYTFTGAIQNGSWDLIIGDSPGPDLNLSYGEIYYKDYLINGEDATFTDNSGSPIGRLKFQSPLGPIEASTYITGLSVVTNETDPIWMIEKSSYYNKSEVDALLAAANMTIIGNETAFDGWDKNASDDFDGAYSSLSGVPTNLTQFVNDAGFITSFSDTLSSLGCSADQYALYNGTAWTCAAKPTDGAQGENLTLNNVIDNGDGTFEWQFSDGTNFTTSDLTGPQGPQGPMGLQGYAGFSVVVNVTTEAPGANCANGGYQIDFYRDVNNDGIYTYLTDFPILGTSYSCKGDQGIQGIQGPTGDNLTMSSIQDNGDGTYTWSFSDGTNFTTSNLTGPIGPQGPAGPQGINGTDGADGTSVNITSVQDNLDGTYTWIFSDGTNFTTSDLTGPAGADGVNGTDGADGTSVNITSVQDNGDGTFTWYFSDGYNFTTSNLTGPQGIQGIQGPAGADGADGVNGTDGADGTSVNITSVQDHFDGTFTWFFSDGTNFTTSNLTGPIGPQGPAGADGADGVNGTDGADGANLTMSSINNNGDGTYTWYFSDGTNYTTGNLTGPQGIQGVAGADGADGVNGTDGADGTSVNMSSVQDNGDGTYTWSFSDGTNFTTGNLTGPQGIQGVAGINGTDGADGANLTMTSITNNGDGTYTWNFSDSTSYTTGNLTGPQGPAGADGADGVNGTDGADGANLTLNNVIDNGDGTFEWQFSDGTNFTTSNLTGPAGADGADGVNGTDGVNGSDGADGTSVNMSSVQDNGDGTYTWYFSDGYNFTTSNLTGPIGPQGPQGEPGVNGTDGIDGVNGTSFDVGGAYLYNNGSDVIFFNDSALPAETDPVFLASPAYNITMTNITNWDAAYEWGDHSTAGYLTSINGSDTAFDGWDKNASDDFDGAFNSLTGVPTGLADGDNDTLGDLSCGDEQVIMYNATSASWQCIEKLSFSDTTCSADGSCTNITYDSETTAWDKNASDDFNGSWNALTDIPAGFADGVDNDGLKTGLLTGGVGSINSSDNRYVDITGGTSLYVDYTNASNPVIEVLTFPGTTLFSNLSGKSHSWAVVERVSPGVGQIVDYGAYELDQDDYRTKTRLIKFWGRGEDNVTGVGQFSIPAFDTPQTLTDLIVALGTISKEGNTYALDASTLLLDKTAGQSFRYGANYKNEPTSANWFIDTALDNIGTYYYHLYGRPYGVSASSIDPDNYDNAGVKTAVPTDKYTIQRVYYFPGSQQTHVTYGQTWFNTLEEAKRSVNDPYINLESYITDGSILAGWIIMKQGITDFSDPEESVFYPASEISAAGIVTEETDPLYTAFIATNPNLDLDSTDDFSGSWNNLTDIPADLADGDNDTIATLNCSDGEIIEYNATSSAWECTTISLVDTVLNESQVDAYVANNGYLTSYTETDPLWTGNSTLVVYTANTTAWDKNASDDFNGSWNALTDIPAGFSDGVDNDTTDAASITLADVAGHFDTDNVESAIARMVQLQDDLWSSGWVSGGDLLNAGDNIINITAGVGYARDGIHIKKVEWNAVNNINLSEGETYFSVDSTGTINQGATYPSSDEIYLGLAYISASNTGLVNNEKGRGIDADYWQNSFMRNGIGPLVESGLSVTIGGDNVSLTVGTGNVHTQYNEYDTAQITSFRQFYLVNGSWYLSGISGTINTTHYNDVTSGLVPIPAGNYTRGLLLIDYQRDIGYYVWGQELYETDTEADNAPNPTIPDALAPFSVKVVGIVTGEPIGAHLDLYDLRPNLDRLFGSATIGAVGGVSTSHGSLTDLTADDHPQYLLVSGTRSMTGDLNLGANDINNIGTVTAIQLSGALSWTNLTGVPAGFADGVDNDTQLNESQVDAYVANNGYLTNESDPVFLASPAYNITMTNITNWDAAYEWGDHSTAGYLTAEADTLQNVTDRNSTTTNAITVGGLTSNANITISNGDCVVGSSGGYICFNSTHTWIG